MARLSTGQAFGEASRASAAQLLGGIPTDASGGALAQGSINAPSLQPRATPVDTFQRVGAPTLGGPPKFFAPPDLPNPGQDLANLSKALGGFSSTLQSFSETYLANKQEQDKKVEAATGALVGQASRFGPARGIADLAANLEKAAALGNPDAARMLQVVREKQNSSIGKYWLGRSIEQNAIQGAALSLPDLVANTSMIKGADGKDIELNTLSSDDPRYLAWRDGVLFGGGQMSPQGYTKNQGIIVQAQLQADQIQRKKYNTAQGVRLVGQVAVDTQKTAEKYVLQRATGNPESAEDAATMSLQQSLDAIRILPLPEETKTKLTNDLLENFAAEVGSAAKQSSFSFLSSDMDAVLRPVLSRVMTGPVDQRVKADGVTANESLRLFNTLGGNPYLDQLVAKANQGLIQGNTQKAQMAGIQEQQAFDARLAAALPEGRRSDPAAIKGFFQTERERAAVEPDGIKRAAIYSQLDASERQLTETFVKPVQEQRALWYTQQLANTAGDEAARNRLQAQLQADLAADRVSNTTAISIQTTLSAQGSKEVRTYDKDINKRIDTMSKEWEAYSGSPGSYRDSTVTSFESQALYKARDDARRRSQEVVYQAIKDGKDPVQALNQLWTNSNFGLRRREEGVPGPMYTDTTRLIQKNTGNWSRSTIAPREANQLRSQAKVRPLMEADSFATDVDAFLNGSPSQNFRTLMKTLTTGAGGQKPSEVILNQFRLLGIDVPEDQRQRIRSLDGQEISKATPARRQSPQQNGALAGVQIVGGALGNLLVPPAQARPNGDLGNQLAAQLEARGGYEDTAGPAVQRRPWSGAAGQFAPKGSFQNGLDAINKAGASVMGFLAGKPNDVELVTRFYSKNPEVANQYDLPVNLFVRYISGLGAKGLAVSQEQGRRVLSQIEAAKQNVPAMVAWTEQNMSPAYVADYKRTVAKGMIPVSGSIPKRDAEIDNSLGRFWATPQKDGSYLITEDFNFSYAPKAQGGDDKRAAMTRRMSVIPSPDPVNQARRLVTGGFGKPFKYTLRISPDGRVQVNP
jgi:hypothetical protein